MRINTGYYYKCGKCGARLDDDVNFLLYQLNPIRFGCLIKECPKCGVKYKSHNLEFFIVTNKICNKLLISSLITWVLLMDFIIVGINVIFFEKVNEDLFFIILLLVDIVFSIFYFVNFKKRWKKAIRESVKRFNNTKYIIDLLLAKILDLEGIEECYKNGLIMENIYNDVLFEINKISQNCNIT